jgi:hypothetical protein
MTVSRRPSLVNANMTQLSEHLLAQDISTSMRQEIGDALYITHDVVPAALDIALASFVNDPEWRPPLPGDLPAHAQHLVTYLAATPAQIAALTQAQKDHVLQDCVRALRWYLDERLGT